MESTRIVKAAGYCRVSTLLNQSPEAQAINIRMLAEARGFNLVELYTDHGVSGTRERRPSLDQLVCDARLGRFHVLIVTGIDRIGRNTKHLLNLIDELQHYGVSLISIRENLDFTSPLGKATFSILSAVSQLERDLTSERIKSALAAKKLKAEQSGNGWRCGRPQVVTAEIEKQVLALRSEGLSLRNIERRLNKIISRTSIVRILQKHRGK